MLAHFFQSPMMNANSKRDMSDEEKRAYSEVLHRLRSFPGQVDVEAFLACAGENIHSICRLILFLSTSIFGRIKLFLKIKKIY